MIRETAFAAVLAAGLGMTGCTTTGAIDSAMISTIQADAQLACSFLPTASSIAALLSANPAIGTAEQVVALICAAVGANVSPTKRIKRFGQNVTLTVYVKGVRITGTLM